MYRGPGALQLGVLCSKHRFFLKVVFFWVAPLFAACATFGNTLRGNILCSTHNDQTDHIFCTLLGESSTLPRLGSQALSLGTSLGGDVKRILMLKIVKSSAKLCCQMKMDGADFILFAFISHKRIRVFYSPGIRSALVGLLGGIALSTRRAEVQADS